MLISVNERERQILTMAFDQLHIQTTQTTPSFSNYVKILQYNPDIIVMELPRLNNDQIHFSSLIRKNKKTRKIPIIGYGDRAEEAAKRYFVQKGINNYLERPLKFSTLMEIIQKYLKIMNKSVEIGAGNKSSEKEEDLKLILDPATLPTKKIELIVKHVAGLTAFPFTVAKVLRLADSDKSGAADLAKVIEADPVISTSILKVSNTVFFASVNRTISTIKDAIVRVGFRETKRIVMAMSVMDLFGKENKSFGFNRMDFWLHSLATALISERIAKRMNDVSTDEAFLAGLLHDFGILLYDEFFPTLLKQIIEETTNNGSRFSDNERKLLKITRNDVLAELFTIWKIPDSISAAVSKQCSICNEQNKPETPNDKIALCTGFGNILAKVFCLGGVCDEYITPLENSHFEAVKMSMGLGKDFYETLKRDLDIYKKFLNIKDEPKEPVTNKKQIAIFNPDNSLFVPVEDYLKVQGHEVVRIAKSNTYTGHDQKYDAIIAWATPQTSYDSIEPLTSILQRTDKPIDGKDQPRFVPVLAMIYQGSSLAAGNVQKISRMYNTFDLRKLDENLGLMIEEKQVIALPKTDDLPASGMPPKQAPAQTAAAEVATMEVSENIETT